MRHGRIFFACLAVSTTLVGIANSSPASAQDHPRLSCNYRQDHGQTYRDCAFDRTYKGTRVDGFADYTLNYGPGAETGKLSFRIYDLDNSNSSCGWARLSDGVNEIWHHACGQGQHTAYEIDLGRDGSPPRTGTYKLQACGERKLKTCIKVWDQQIDQPPPS